MTIPKPSLDGALVDVFRQLHGYGGSEFSWHPKRHGAFTNRRFDHVSALAALTPVACRYLHAWWESGLSDHAAPEVVFAPQIALPGSDLTAPE